MPSSVLAKVLVVQYYTTCALPCAVQMMIILGGVGAVLVIVIISTALASTRLYSLHSHSHSTPEPSRPNAPDSATARTLPASFCRVPPSHKTLTWRCAFLLYGSLFCGSALCFAVRHSTLAKHLCDAYTNTL